MNAATGSTPAPATPPTPATPPASTSPYGASTAPLHLFLMRIVRALRLPDDSTPEAVESRIDEYIRHLARAGRAAGATDALDPVNVADAVEQKIESIMGLPKTQTRPRPVSPAPASPVHPAPAPPPLTVFPSPSMIGESRAKLLDTLHSLRDELETKFEAVKTVMRLLEEKPR